MRESGKERAVEWVGAVVNRRVEENDDDDDDFCDVDDACNPSL